MGHVLVQLNRFMYTAFHVYLKDVIEGCGSDTKAFNCPSAIYAMHILVASIHLLGVGLP